MPISVVTCVRRSRTATSLYTAACQHLFPNSRTTAHLHKHYSATTTQQSLATETLISQSRLVDNSASSQQQLVSNLQRNGLITSATVVDALSHVDRADFCPPSSSPYSDSPQPIGQLATISAPAAHAIALQALDRNLVSGSHVLDVGSGSGYLSVCMALMVGENGRVTAIDHSHKLSQQAIINTRKSHARLLQTEPPNSRPRLSFYTSDGHTGYPAHAPYQVIHVGAAAEQIPPLLLDQLAIDGMLLIPIMHEKNTQLQRLQLITRSSIDSFQTTVLSTCSYAPMRFSPPAANVDDLNAYRAKTDQIEQRIQQLMAYIKSWHSTYKEQHNGKSPSLAKMQADVELQSCLTEYAALQHQVKNRKKVEAENERWPV